jgi:hypothetical protein
MIDSLFWRIVPISVAWLAAPIACVSPRGPWLVVAAVTAKEIKRALTKRMIIMVRAVFMVGFILWWRGPASKQRVERTPL